MKQTRRPTSSDQPLVLGNLVRLGSPPAPPALLDIQNLPAVGRDVCVGVFMLYGVKESFNDCR